MQYNICWEDKVKYYSEHANHAKDLASFFLHACCDISKVVQKTQRRKPAMRNVTHRRLFWLHFPSPSRQEMFSGSQRGKQKPELKVDSSPPPPPLHTITLKERKPYGDRVITEILTAFRWLQIKKKDCQQMHPSTLPLLHMVYYNTITSTPINTL